MTDRKDEQMSVEGKRLSAPSNASELMLLAPRLSERAKRTRTNRVLQEWRVNVALRACSVAARGLWLDMVCIMHESTPYGYLTINGSPMRAHQLARAVGGSEKLVIRLLAELAAVGVFNRSPGGWIFSREMVWDV